MDKIITTEQYDTIIKYVTKNAPNSHTIGKETILVKNVKGDTLGSIFYVALEPPMIKVTIIGIELIVFLGWKSDGSQQKLLAPPKELPIIRDVTPITKALPKKIFTRDIPRTVTLQ